MQQHIVAYNNNYGLCNNKESFIEQGHQIGIKENHRYQGMTNFSKENGASLKVQTIATHPLIIEQSQKVLQHEQRGNTQIRSPTAKREGRKLKAIIYKKKRSRKK
jgi:hypothetical protein